MRVLVVDDDLPMAAAIRRALRSVNVIGDVATTSQSACAMLADTPYDVIVLDAMLPDADGFATCRRLRKAGDWTPIIMVTARAAVDDRIRGLDAGADDYLTKPFSFGELLARLRALARRDLAERPVVIAVGSLRLDPASAQVWRGEQEIRLSTREFALLEFLLRNPGRVLSRALIAQHVWGVSFDTFTNVIDVYVNYLRRKVDADFEPKLIQTVRGAGYVLRAPEL